MDVTMAAALAAILLPTCAVILQRRSKKGSEREQKNEQKKRFPYIVDKETGVQYLYHMDGYGGGLCTLLDRDGKPVLSDHHNH